MTNNLQNTRRKIDIAVVRSLWNVGYTTGEIAKKLDVKSKSINRVARLAGVQAPNAPSKHRPQREECSKPPPDPKPTRAPGGYADVNAMVANDGITLRQAMQRFHRSRA